MAESNHLRMEAMQLLEHCLTNGDDAPLVTFIERQLLHEPPRLDLLRDLANDLQQRLLSLREYHFDVRERIVSMLKDSYNVDVTPLTPPNQLGQYHHLDSKTILRFIREKNVILTDADTILLQKVLDASIQMAAQLHSDILLAARLHKLVLDWLNGINATVARRYWTTTFHNPPASHKNHRHH